MQSPVKIAAIFVQLICIIKSQKYLSHDGTPSQSTTFVWGNHGLLFAKLAVTGGPTNDFDSVSCSHTAEKQNIAWWMLAFPGKTIYFTNVKIFYRSNFQKRLAGYSLYVTNSSVTGTSPKPTNGHLCFHHTGTTLPSINQTVDCNVLGQYIVIYNERNSTVNDKYHGYSEHALLELCDVQIYGCHKTWFGEDCNQRCSLKCTDQHCYPWNGSCVWGCSCLRDNCDNSTICTEGCNRGYAGQYCNQYNLASFGTATQQSTQGDPDLAIDSDRTAGSCSKPSGQEAWWQVDLGQLSVIKNIYIYISAVFSGGGNGPYVYATNTSGSQTDGMLLTMTIDLNNTLPILSHYADPYIMGRYVIYVPGSVNVDLCEVEVVGCPVGRFGQDCNQTCPENCHGSCHLETGRCIYGCNNGWLNQYCNQSCTAGTFGSQCLEDCHCSNVSFPCNHIHGTCPEGGCPRGYKGSSCYIECSAGTYGYNCEDSCEGCLLDTCDKRNGTCTDQNGCKPGWQSKLPMCDLACESGTFGQNCANTCYCINQSCDSIKGVCPPGGCERGYTSSICSTECSLGQYWYNCNQSCDGCLSDSCDKEDGNCTDKSGCKPGWQYIPSEHQKCDIVNLPPPEPQTTNIGPIAGGIGGVAVAIMLVVILVIFIRRHRSHSKKSKYRESRHSTNTNNYENHYPNKDIGSLKGNKQLDGAVGSTKATAHVKISIPPSNQKMSYKASTQDHVYTNHVSDEEGGIDEFVYSNSEDITKYRIPLTELQNVINEKYRDDGFLKEYKILPHGLVHPHIEGSKEENKIKNRFLTTWPYDHSRVILQGNPSSDYINASYIDSYSREKAYIASQGPKKHTIKDFWQMVWQEKVDIIVMVTKLEEERKNKCEQYWPESTSNPFVTGQFKVSLSQEREHTDHVYRMIRLLNKESKSERTVHHFHFTQWPDHGVPDKIKLVSFYRKVKMTTTCLNGPMVVHCSAGVGRTGTFIAIDALYEHGQKTGYIDIMEYVQMMRKDRMNMIQTKEQYTTVFEALLEAFTVPDTSIDKDHFCTYLENQQLNITPKNQTFQNLEFQKLKDTKPTYSDKSYKAAMSKENAAKNVVENILPHDKYRPFLMSYEKSRTDYINAVIIPGYIGTGKYLVTQYPLQDTVVDFWTMVYDTDSTVVVMLKSVDESVPLWPQKSDVFHFSKFNVSVKSDNTSFPLSLTLTHKDTNRNTTVRILSMDDWNAENIPSSGTCMLNLLNSASSWRKDHPGSVTVVCQDGCKRSGIFAALSLVLEKMELDDEVDILQVVRTIQVRRPEFFPSFNQYEYCYRCIKEHLEGNSLYANA